MWPLRHRHARRELVSVGLVPLSSCTMGISLGLPAHRHAASCSAQHRCVQHGLPPPGLFRKRILNIHLLILKRVF